MKVTIDKPKASLIFDNVSIIEHSTVYGQHDEVYEALDLYKTSNQPLAHIKLTEGIKVIIEMAKDE